MNNNQGIVFIEFIFEIFFMLIIFIWILYLIMELIDRNNFFIANFLASRELILKNNQDSTIDISTDMIKKKIRSYMYRNDFLFDVNLIKNDDKILKFNSSYQKNKFFNFLRDINLNKDFEFIK